jgi:hypothetical protein
MGAAPREWESADLATRLREIGRRVGAREAEHGEALRSAQETARGLRAEVARGIEAFHAAAAAAGAPHLRIDLGDVRLDEKHARAVQFDLRRGRHVAIVTVKSRGEVTLVGPFRTGKTEGPCLSFPVDAETELRAALGDFLERFLDEAATP